MKNALMKFAGFFVEKVPVEAPVPRHPSQHGSAQHGTAHGQQGQQGELQLQQQPLLQGHFPSPSGTTAVPMPRQSTANPLSVALRAWVPQEYAGYLAPFGLHVIAAGGEITVEQARAYGAQVLIVSSECLGSHTHLLANPQLPTVFIAPQPMLIPARPGVVQAQEPLRASDVANASRDAVDSWSQAQHP